MALSKFITFPWDAENPLKSSGDPSQPYPGIGSQFLPSLPPDAYDAYTFFCPLKTMQAFYARVRQWTFSANIDIYDSPGGTLVDNGSFTIVCDAMFGIPVNHEGLSAMATNERQLCQHAGWLGDTGDSRLTLWPRIYPSGQFDEYGADRGFVGVTPEPPSLILPVPFDEVDVGHPFVHDACPLVLTLPVTKNGSFDGYGSTVFNMQLHGPELGQIIGSATLTPTAFWPYDGGDGPVYDASTGAILRAPPVTF